MKILHVLQSSHFSGAENVVCQIIDMFKDDSNIISAYTSQDGQIREALDAREVTFFPMHRLCHSELKKVVKLYEPDIIHGHDVRGAFEASRFGKRAKIVHTIHGNPLRMRSMSAKSVLYAFAARKATHIFWVSKTCLEQYRFPKVVMSKSSVLYNTVNPEDIRKKYELDKHEYQYDIVFIGRLTMQKNPQRLMRVLKIVVGQLPLAKVAIVGAGDLAETTKELSDAYGLEGNVDFLGYLNNPLKILGSAKLMLLTSDWEGCPMVASGHVHERHSAPLRAISINGIC